jgi:phosphopantothenate-cysteine ligase
VKAAIKAAKTAQDDGCLLQVPFVTLYDYLVLLRCAAESVRVAGRKAIIFAAAAVSDFYLPSDKVAEHKIQSSAGPLKLEFACVPKMVKALKELWCPDAFVVTFKLETDPALLTRKAMIHLATGSTGYGVQAVIGNLLSEHKDKVTFFTASDAPIVITRTEDERAKDEDLEKRLIPVVSASHSNYLSAETSQ